MADVMMTGELLLDFLDREARSGRLHAGTASSRRSAVREVLQVSFDPDWETTVFGVQDVPALLQAFVDARTGEFAGNTISSYRSNFGRTVELYVDDHDDTKTGSAGRGWITYRFQLRGSEVVEFELPGDLTVAEARRLARFITTLPLDAED